MPLEWRAPDGDHISPEVSRAPSGFALPRLRLQPLDLSQATLRTVLIGSILVLVALIAFGLHPLGALSGGHRVASANVSHAVSSGAAAPVQAALPGLEAMTGLKYQSAACAPDTACLHLVGQTDGVGAAALQFATAASAGRGCEAFVYSDAGGWHYLNAVCALPDQLSPVVGRDATVHVPGDCANVHVAVRLNSPIAACLQDGTSVRIDGGPDYVDGKLWWHLKGRGWMAHEFLLGNS
jgi:hypothetical protein